MWNDPDDQCVFMVNQIKVQLFWHQNGGDVSQLLCVAQFLSPLPCLSPLRRCVPSNSDDSAEARPSPNLQLIRWSATGYLPWSCFQSSPVRPRHYCGSYSSSAHLRKLIRVPSRVVIHCSPRVFSSSPPGFTPRSSCLPSSLKTSRRYILPQLPHLKSSVLEK